MGRGPKEAEQPKSKTENSCNKDLRLFKGSKQSRFDFRDIGLFRQAYQSVSSEEFKRRSFGVNPK
ncbi:hypothetical protein GCM10007919_21670 [Rhizobium indigoferae]|nr:hypothetical protein GCM10007919_21670 [Rhizobium indigoferae]